MNTPFQFASTGRRSWRITALVFIPNGLHFVNAFCCFNSRFNSRALAGRDTMLEMRKHDNDSFNSRALAGVQCYFIIHLPFLSHGRYVIIPEDEELSSGFLFFFMP